MAQNKLFSRPLMLLIVLLMSAMLMACGSTAANIGAIADAARIGSSVHDATSKDKGGKAPAQTQETIASEKEIKKALKKYIGTSGNFKKFAKSNKFVVTDFSVEYTYQRYTSRVGEETKIGNTTKTALSDGYQTLKLRDEDYARLTDAIYDSFVSAISELGHALGMRVTGEGAETEEHRQLLQACHVDYLQGYFDGPPLTERAATARLFPGQPLNKQG